MSVYDQEMPQSQIIDQPMAPWGRDSRTQTNIKQEQVKQPTLSPFLSLQTREDGKSYIIKQDLKHKLLHIKLYNESPGINSHILTGTNPRINKAWC